MRPIRPPEVAIRYLAQHDEVIARALSQRLAAEAPSTIVRRAVHGQRDLARSGLILAAIHELGRATAGEIALAMGQQTAVVSACLQNICRQGYTRRVTPAPGEGRSFVYALTSAGRDRVREEARQ